MKTRARLSCKRLKLNLLQPFEANFFSYFVTSRLGVEIDKFRNGFLANDAKLRVFVGAHSAVGKGAIYSFQIVASSFVDADFSIVGWGRDGGVFVEHRLPFLREIGQRGDVRLPRLHVVWIHWNILSFIGVFVGQPCKTMSKFVHDHGAELRMARHGQIVGVEDAASAVVLGVHKHDDVFVGNAGQKVVQVLEVERGEVAIAVERVEM